MRKIQTIFERDPDNPKLVLNERVEECSWVFAGEGQPTEKFDGSACLVRDGKLYARHRVKEGRKVPVGWIHWNFEEPCACGHGWIPVVEGNPAQDYHREAWDSTMADGTYELVGPKLQGNPYRLREHRLWLHGCNPLPPCTPPSFHTIQAYLMGHSLEGIVWHHPDGRMAKIKRRDFGIPWPGNVEA